MEMFWELGIFLLNFKPYIKIRQWWQRAGILKQKVVKVSSHFPLSFKDTERKIGWHKIASTLRWISEINARICWLMKTTLFSVFFIFIFICAVEQ